MLGQIQLFPTPLLAYSGAGGIVSIQESISGRGSLAVLSAVFSQPITETDSFDGLTFGLKTLSAVGSQDLSESDSFHGAAFGLSALSATFSTVISASDVFHGTGQLSALVKISALQENFSDSFNGSGLLKTLSHP